MLINTDFNKTQNSELEREFNKIQDCEYSFTTNKCIEDIRPALRAQCKEWDECRKRNPQEEVLSIGVVTRMVSDVLNKFTGSLNWKSWVFLAGVIFLICSVLKNCNITVN